MEIIVKSLEEYDRVSEAATMQGVEIYYRSISIYNPGKALIRSRGQLERWLWADARLIASGKAYDSPVSELDLNPMLRS